MQDSVAILENPSDPGQAVGPVCGISVTLGTGKPSMKHKGETCHFCSPKHHDTFDPDPHFYLSGNRGKEKRLNADKSASGALGLATPVSLTTLTGKRAQAGVPERPAESLERLAEVDVFVVNKAGTLFEWPLGRNGSRDHECAAPAHPETLRA